MVQRGLYCYRQRLRVIKVSPQEILTTVMTHMVDNRTDHAKRHFPFVFFNNIISTSKKVFFFSKRGLIKALRDIITGAALSTTAN